MSAIKNITVYSNIPNLIKELTCVLPNITFHQFKNEDADKISLNSNEIIVADCDLILPHLNDLTANVKWIQMTWAGLDALLKTSNVSECALSKLLITRYSGEAFGRIMSEYVISAIVNHERDMFKIKQNQKQSLWSLEGKIHQYRIISDFTIGILGVGQIGTFVAQCLHSLGAKIWSFGKTDRHNLPTYIDQYFTREKLPLMLQNCDYLINTLPTTKETVNLLGDDLLSNCKSKETVFINIGRGAIINENDLIKALEKKWLSAAILDVFETEPLPENSILWKMDQVFITPHVSAVSRAKDVAEQFAKNYQLYCDHQEIPAKYDYQRGY